MSIEQIKDDLDLRGYFFELITKNFMLGLTSVFELRPTDYVKLQKEYYDSYLKLSTKLAGHVSDTDMFEVIQQVSLFYIERIGRVSFVQGGIDRSTN